MFGSRPVLELQPLDTKSRLQLLNESWEAIWADSCRGNKLGETTLREKD
jgi:hypothetical protein